MNALMGNATCLDCLGQVIDDLPCATLAMEFAVIHHCFFIQSNRNQEILIIIIIIINLYVATEGLGNNGKVNKLEAK